MRCLCHCVFFFRLFAAAIYVLRHYDAFYFSYYAQRAQVYSPLFMLLPLLLEALESRYFLLMSGAAEQDILRSFDFCAFSYFLMVYSAARLMEVRRQPPP